MRKLLTLITLLFWAGAAQAQTYGATQFVSATPTVDTAAYATGELVGGKLTFTPAVRSSTGTGYVVSVIMADKAAQAVDFDLVLFRENPSSTTFTDQAAFDVADADLTKVIAVVDLDSSSSAKAFADNSVHYVGNLVLPVQGYDSSATPTVTKTIYGALVSRGAPTFATSGDVTITLGISQD